MELNGCRSLVVGGAHRLGRAVALALARDGGAVAVSSRALEAAEAARTELTGFGRPAAAVTGDVTSHIDAHHLVRAAATALGGLDAIVFAASGPFEPQPPESLTEDDWNASMDVLPRGLLFIAQAAREQFLTERAHDAGPGVAAERGVIVALTDIGAVQPWAAFAAHCAAKAAQLMLVRTLAKAWTADGIRVCGVAPGPVDLADDRRREASVRAAAGLPTGRLVRPEDVVAAVEYCITTRSVTGANMVVDGGALLR